MTDHAADLPARLADRLDEVRRDEPLALDLLAPDSLTGGQCAVRLRIITADPLEGERKGLDRFVADHRWDTDREVVGYLSFGQAERDAQEVGWAALLGLLAHALAESAEHDEPPIGAAHGRDPLVILPDEPLPLEGWQVEEWRPWTVGVLIDLAEAEDGPMGFPAAGLEPVRTNRATDGCAACAGTVLHAPHLPLDVAEGLCTPHRRQQEEWVADALQAAEEDPDTFMSLILDMDAVFISGVGAGLGAIDRGDETPAGLLRRARTWFDEPGGLSPVYWDDDDLALTLIRGTSDIAEEEGADAGLAALDDLRFLVPEGCWMFDMDSSAFMEATDPRQRELLNHMRAEHTVDPGALVGTAELHELLEEREEAIRLFRMAWTRGMAAGQEVVADAAEGGLRRLGETPPQPTTRVGRNDPCPCGSGRKFKKCCGR